MVSIYELLGVPRTGFSSEPFTTSWAMGRTALATIRLVVSLYIVISISYSYAYFAGHKVTFHLQDVGIEPVTFQVGAEGIRQSFSYFTYLSYWSQSFYFFFASMHTFVAARGGTSWLDRWPKFLQAAHAVFYSCVTVLPFLVSSVYWASMYIGPFFEHDFDRFSALSIHALNSTFAIFEIALANTSPYPWAHLGVLLAILGLYLPVAYITRATENIYIYLWLDPENGVPQLLGHIIGYAMAAVVLFNISRGAICIRRMAIRANGPTSNSTMPAEDLSYCSNARQHRLSAFRSLRSTDDLEKFEGSSINIPLAQRGQRAPSSIYQVESPSRNSTTTIAMPSQFHEASNIHIPLPPEPEPIHRPNFPSRSSSYHVRNFSRPTSQITTAPSLRGFWL